MVRFLLSRLAQSVFILIGVTMITFALAFLVPADPVRMIAGRNATPTVVENIRHQLGLDRPIPLQYANYVARLAQGDFGRSYMQRTEDIGLMARRVARAL